MANRYVSYHFSFPSQNDVPGGKVMVTTKGGTSEKDAKSFFMQMQSQYISHCERSPTHCSFYTHVVKGIVDCDRVTNLTVCNNNQMPELIPKIQPETLVCDEVVHLNMPPSEKQDYMRIDFSGQKNMQ